MSGALETRIASLRGQVRRLLALHGLGRIVAIAVPVVLFACLADYLIHLATEVRLTILVGLVVLLVALAWRHVVGPLVLRFRDLDIALKIEKRWPGLNDRLTSAVQFLELRGQGDSDSLGSPALREATVRQTLIETRSIDFREVVDRRPVYRALFWATAGLAVCGVFYAMAPRSSEIALTRLFRPLSGSQWPKSTHLRIVAAVEKVAKGDPFALEVAAAPGEPIPTSGKVTFAYETGEAVVEPLRSDGKGGLHARIESVSTPFRFSAVAGDDRTEPRRVEVVPPPMLVDTKITIVPPAYTGLGRSILAGGRTQVRAVEGTKLEIVATANKPLASAVLQRGEGPAKEKVAVDRTGRSLSVSFVAAESQPFWIALLDRDGFRDRDPVRFDLRAIKDEAPRVAIDEPVSDRDVPANADIPVRLSLEDDYGLHTSRLVYKVADGSSSETTKQEVKGLWAADGKPGVEPVRRKTVSYLWHLEELKLQPGAVVVFLADALDYRDLPDFKPPKGPNRGKSREIRLRIVSPDQRDNLLNRQRQEIRDEIERIKSMQETARRPVTESRRILERVGKLERPARESLKTAAMVQGQVGSRITNKSDGLERKIDQFLEDMKNFKIDNPEIQKGMESMRAGVDRIRDRHLSPAEQGLSRASKALDDDRDKEKAGGVQADKSKPTGDQAKTALANAEDNQTAIVEELRKMLDGLSEFNSIREMVREAERLLKNQEEAIKQSTAAATRPDIAGKSLENMPPAAKADLENLAARQNELSRNLRDFQAKLEETAERNAETDPLGSAALRDAARKSRDQGTAGKMSEAAEQLAKNQMGEARSGQEKAREDLKNLLDSLKNRRETELARLVKELKKSEEELAALAKRQRENLQKTRQARSIPDKNERKKRLEQLAREQEKIEKELRSRLQRLAKLRADSAVRAGSQAAGKMSKARKNLDDDDAEQAAREEQDSLADLQKAREETKNAREEAEEQLAMEQLAKMADRLRQLGERQDKIVSETVDYDKARLARDRKLTPAQRASVRALARVQDAVKDETESLVERLEGAPVFALTLKRAAESMGIAAERLQGLKTDDDTQRAEKSAARRFKQLLDSLKADPPKPGGGGGGGGGGGAGDGIPTAAQLKMLKALQQEVNTRTEELDEIKRREKTLNDAQLEEIRRLQDEQGTIADLTRDLTKPRKTDGED